MSVVTDLQELLDAKDWPAIRRLAPDLAQDVLNLHAALEESNCHGIKAGYDCCPRCDALKLPDLAEAMEGK